MVKTSVAVHTTSYDDYRSKPQRNNSRAKSNHQIRGRREENLHNSSVYAESIVVKAVLPEATRQVRAKPEETKFKNPVYAPLLDKWVMYYHLPDDTRWDLASYTVIMKDIDNPEKLISINEVIPDVIIKNAMLFMMRDGIAPVWEDEKNRKGGYLSFKIVNKFVHQIWKTMVYAVCGQTFFENREKNQYINGLSISPKKTFCIIKIWLSAPSVKDEKIVPIMNVMTSSEEMKYTSFEEQIETDIGKSK